MDIDLLGIGYRFQLYTVWTVPQTIVCNTDSALSSTVSELAELSSSVIVTVHLVSKSLQNSGFADSLFAVFVSACTCG